MRRRLHLAYPALLAVVPIVNRQALNNWPTGWDVVAFGGLLAATIVLWQLACYGALRAVRCRSATAREWAAVLAMGAVVLFYAAPAVSDKAHVCAPPCCATATLPRLSGPPRLAGTSTRRTRPGPRTRPSPTFAPRRTAAVAISAAVLLPGALWWAVRRGRAEQVTGVLPAVGRFLTVAACLVVAWSALPVALAPVRLARVVSHSAYLRDLARPVPVTRPAAVGPPRDVYVLLLDSYPSAEVLRELYAIDNTPFLDSLRALGFRVPTQVRTNYPLTAFAVPTLLNFAQFEPLSREIPAGYRNFGLSEYLFEHNRAAQFLGARGYRTVFFPSVWFPPTRHNRQANVEYPRLPRGGLAVEVGRGVWRSLLVRSFVDETLLRRLSHYLPTEQEVWMADLEHSFAGLAALPARPAGGPPIYAFAHLLIPHPAFLADSACRPLPRGAALVDDTVSDVAVVRPALDAFLACTNRRVLSTVRAILARPGPRPIVVLQGDHGTTHLGLIYNRLDAVTPASVRERYSPFGAYYLPDGGTAQMGDTVSVVNVLRSVFRYYYGADLPPVPNQLYFVDVTKSFAMTPIDTLTLRPVARAGAAVTAR